MENKIEGLCYICGKPLVWDLHLLNKKYSFITKNIQK